MPTTVDGKEVIAAHEKPATPDDVETTPEAEEKPEVNWEDRYKNLEKKLGEQGTELGNLRKENRKMRESAVPVQPSPQPQDGATVDPLTDIHRKVRDGEMSWEDGLVEIGRVAAQTGATQAQQWFQQELGNRDAKQSAQQFLEKHPDFLDLQESGQLDEVMQQNAGVIQDSVAAYFAFKAQQGEEVGYNRAKEELAKLAESEMKTKTVLKKPGSAIRQTNNKPLKAQHEIKASMSSALDRLKEE
jgi:hypothetical protein